MFASAVIPILITLLLMASLAIGLPNVMRRYTERPVLASLGTCALLGFPLLFVVGSVVELIRYGEFHYADATNLNDRYVRVPTDSTDITLHKYDSGHELKFKTTRSSLEAWMNDLTEERGKYANPSPFEVQDRTERDSREFEIEFGSRGWVYPQDAVVYRGWHYDRGGGFDVWFSESEHTAYIRASYW